MTLKLSKCYWFLLASFCLSLDVFMISMCFYIYFYIQYFVLKPMTCHLVAATGSICTCNMTLKQAKLVLVNLFINNIIIAMLHEKHSQLEETYCETPLHNINLKRSACFKRLSRKHYQVKALQGSVPAFFEVLAFTCCSLHNVKYKI